MTGKKPVLPDGPDAAERVFLRRWSFLGLALILVAAARSDGYHQSDEHFQTLEFAAFKLGRTPAAALPWEFREQMRPWLQPGLYVLVLRAVGALGVTDPFHQAFLLRLLSGMLSWAALTAACGSARLWVPDADLRRWAVRLTWLAFYTPYLAVRTSSECLATACALLGLVAFSRATLADRGRSDLLGAGLLFGLAFQFRFALAVMAGGLALWGVLTRRLGAGALAALCIGAAPTLALGALVDRWGYGAWSFPALRYLQLNLGENVAAQRFGSLPWYGYLNIVLHSGVSPLLLLAMVGVAIAWARAPGHVLTAASAPFVLTHVLIAHKELRFVFPLAPLVPSLLAITASPRREGSRVLRGRPVRVALRVLLGLDLVALALFTLLPTRPAIGLQRFVYRHWPGRFEAVLLTPDSPWAFRGLEMHFYRPQELVLNRADALATATPRRQVLVLAGPFERPAVPGYTCEALYRPFPAWLQTVGRWNPRWRVQGHSLHRCRAS